MSAHEGLPITQARGYVGLDIWQTTVIVVGIYDNKLGVVCCRSSRFVDREFDSHYTKAVGSHTLD